MLLLLVLVSYLRRWASGGLTYDQHAQESMLLLHLSKRTEWTLDPTCSWDLWQNLQVYLVVDMYIVAISSRQIQESNLLPPSSKEHTPIILCQKYQSEPLILVLENDANFYKFAQMQTQIPLNFQKRLLPLSNLYLRTYQSRNIVYALHKT